MCVSSICCISCRTSVDDEIIQWMQADMTNKEELMRDIVDNSSLVNVPLFRDSCTNKVEELRSVWLILRKLSMQ